MKVDEKLAHTHYIYIYIYIYTYTHTPEVELVICQWHITCVEHIKSAMNM